MLDISFWEAEKGNSILKYCKTEDQIADILTRDLSKEQFERKRLKLGMMTLNWPNHIQKHLILVLAMICRASILITGNTLFE